MSTETPPNLLVATAAGDARSVAAKVNCGSAAAGVAAVVLSAGLREHPAISKTRNKLKIVVFIITI
jgi:hypothetical protein